MSKPPARSDPAKASASLLDSRGTSRIEGATVGIPPALAISLAISSERRLSRERTLIPPKFEVDTSLPHGTAEPQNRDFSESRELVETARRAVSTVCCLSRNPCQKTRILCLGVQRHAGRIIQPGATRGTLKVKSLRGKSWALGARRSGFPRFQALRRPGNDQ